LTIPSLVLGLVCALLIGSLFHVVVDGGPARLLLYLLLSAAGFALGHWIGNTQNWTYFSVGPLRLGTAALGSLALLGLGHWLTKMSVPAGNNRNKV
jgi:hypothetical protein